MVRTSYTSMRWWWCSLCTRHVNSLRQQPMVDMFGPLRQQPMVDMFGPLRQQPMVDMFGPLRQ